MGKVRRGNWSMQSANSLAVCLIPRLCHTSGVFADITLKLLEPIERLTVRRSVSLPCGRQAEVLVGLWSHRRHVCIRRYGVRISTRLVPEIH